MMSTENRFTLFGIMLWSATIRHENHIVGGPAGDDLPP